jgi:hypothetical protein
MMQCLRVINAVSYTKITCNYTKIRRSVFLVLNNIKRWASGVSGETTRLYFLRNRNTKFTNTELRKEDEEIVRDMAISLHIVLTHTTVRPATLSCHSIGLCQ